LFQRIITYHLFVFFAAAILLSCTDDKKLPPLRESFSKNDRNPFGTFVAYQGVLNKFGGDTVRTETDNFQTAWASITDTASVYIIVSKNLYLSDEERDAMLSYVNSGNSLVISSENIDEKLLDTLHCSMQDMETYDGYYNVELARMGTTSIRLQAPPYAGSDTLLYSYFYYPFSNKFTVGPNFAILGSGGNFLPDFIATNYGQGRIYLQCEPRSLSNYFLLQRNNYCYLQELLSFMPRDPQDIYWDDYYNKHNYSTDGRSQSSLSYILQFPAMAWAFWLLLLLLIIYILFGGKRRQRTVAIIKPNKNTTVAFAETIGRLYLQKKDNRNMADKIISYFYEQIRNQYFLNTNHITPEFLVTLSRKSNVPKETIEKLFDLISELQQTDKIKDEEILSLNQQIENFNKNKI